MECVPNKCITGDHNCDLDTQECMVKDDGDYYCKCKSGFMYDFNDLSLTRPSNENGACFNIINIIYPFTNRRTKIYK